MSKKLFDIKPGDEVVVQLHKGHHSKRYAGKSVVGKLKKFCESSEGLFAVVALPGHLDCFVSLKTGDLPKWKGIVIKKVSKKKTLTNNTF